MFPMHDHPFSFQMHYIRTRRITGGNSGEFNQCSLWNPTQSNFCCASIHKAPRSSGMQAWCVCVCVHVERAVACSKSQQTLPRSAGGWTEWRAKWDWEMQPPTWQKRYSDDAFLLVSPPSSWLLSPTRVKIRIISHLCSSQGSGCLWTKYLNWTAATGGGGKVRVKAELLLPIWISAIWNQPASPIRRSSNTNYTSNHRCDMRNRSERKRRRCRNHEMQISIRLLHAKTENTELTSLG